MKKYVIAEVGSVHDGSVGNALKLVDLALDCGADAIKFQTHIPEAETLISAPSPSYFSEESRFEYFKRTAFSFSQWEKIANHAKSSGIEFLSSPFSLEAVDLLEKIGVVAYKIPSGEVTNIPLLEKISKLNKPVLLSSGMSSWVEIDAAVQALKDVKDIVIMQCTSMYPCPPNKVGLNVLSEINRRYKCIPGFSDHTLGCAAPIAAAICGAQVIEKHLTFSKKMYGSDAKHSMEPPEFKNLVLSLRDAWAMSSSIVDKDDVADYREMKKIFEKSIVSSRPIKSGKIISMDDLSFKKPGDGIPAGRYKDLIGKKINQDLGCDVQFKLDMFI